MKYVLVETTYYDRNFEHTGYGMAAIEREGGHVVVLKSANDMSTDREKVEELIGLCNQYGLELVHFDDIVEDFMT